MHFQTTTLISVLALPARATSSQVTLLDLYCGKTATKTCYHAPDSTPRDLNLVDITFVVSYLRTYNHSVLPANMLTMPAASDCAEWSLYTAGTVLVLAKHIDPKSTSS
ncbi:hypothetical protein BJ878DRAFT_477159 [Calycina marina]|uniref:Uncharacterized protein n=1 Tax=Calycina marina TaxID=1763456 RepID=A0A9P7Z9D2_9HELO|nr:hypothetical protein BJ878DRAFT_477159 [Calycina marina]